MTSEDGFRIRHETLTHSIHIFNILPSVVHGTMKTTFKRVYVFLLIHLPCEAFLSPGICSSKPRKQPSVPVLFGWLDEVLGVGSSPRASDDSTLSVREIEFPEQYPATYDLSKVSLFEFGDARTVRPLLKNTQLESRPLQVVYDANWQGYNAKAFHRAVDGKGAAVVLCQAKGRVFGGYNPKGWSGNGGARPSVASFLFYRGRTGWKKLRKIGGGGLACAKDDPDTGIFLGADGLVVPLSTQDKRACSSYLGTYFERAKEGNEEIYSIVPGGACKLDSLKVLVGVYAKGEEIPYSGAVLDFTSG